ncbi:MAG: GntR family transcriptional regulator [Clostridiaceae bacterium]|nr:GntR family transcriptional regulator [Clostridiaceae bacterium]
MKIDFDKNKPIYLQILDDVKNQLVSGKLKANQRLPSIRDLADELEVTPNTIQRVYRELESEKLSYTERGTGSYITQDPDVIENLKQALIREEVIRFHEQMQQFGLTDDQIFQQIKKYTEGRE